MNIQYGLSVEESFYRDSRLNASPENFQGKCLEGNRQSLIQCLAESSRSVFSSMCHISLEVVLPMQCPEDTQRSVVSGIIGLGGALSAMIAVNLQIGLLSVVTEKMLGYSPTAIDAEVTDLVGELTNMIGGNAKKRMSLEGVTLGLPTVVAGAGHVVAFGSDMEVTPIWLTSNYGSLLIELGLVTKHSQSCVGCIVQ